MTLASDTSFKDPLDHPRVRWSRLRIRWPFLVWLAAAVTAAFIFFYGAHTGGMMGFVEIIEHPVAAVEIGRVTELRGAVGQVVKAGQVLALLDTAALDAEIRAEEALRREALASVPAQDQVALQWDRQFGVALATAQAALDEQRIGQAQDRAEQAVLKTELARLEPLLQRRLIESSALVPLRARYAALTEALSLYDAAIERLAARVAAARRQMEEAQGSARAATVGGGTNFQVQAQEGRVGVLTARRGHFVLTAPAAGVIGRIDYRPGDVVPAGIPVLSLVEDTPENVIALIPEINARDYRVGQKVRVQRTYEFGRWYPARIAQLEPAVRGLPGQITPVPGRVIRGRRAVCRLEGPTDLVPGETIEIKVILPFWDPLVDWVRKLILP